MNQENVWSWVLDLNFIFLSSDNAKSLTGFDDEYLIGTDAQNLRVSDSDPNDSRENMSNEEAGYNRARLEIFTKKGPPIYVDYIAVPVLNKVTQEIIAYRGASRLSRPSLQPPSWALTQLGR